MELEHAESKKRKLMNTSLDSLDSLDLLEPLEEGQHTQNPNPNPPGGTSLKPAKKSKKTTKKKVTKVPAPKEDDDKKEEKKEMPKKRADVKPKKKSQKLSKKEKKEEKKVKNEEKMHIVGPSNSSFSLLMQRLATESLPATHFLLIQILFREKVPKEQRNAVKKHIHAKMNNIAYEGIAKEEKDNLYVKWTPVNKQGGGLMYYTKSHLNDRVLRNFTRMCINDAVGTIDTLDPKTIPKSYEYSVSVLCLRNLDCGLQVLYKGNGNKTYSSEESDYQDNKESIFLVD